MPCQPSQTPKDWWFLGLTFIGEVFYRVHNDDDNVCSPTAVPISHMSSVETCPVSFHFLLDMPYNFSDNLVLPPRDCV